MQPDIIVHPSQRDDNYSALLDAIARIIARLAREAAEQDVLQSPPAPAQQAA
jgi:hypothetical protein